MNTVMSIAMKDMGFLIETAQANMKYLMGPVYNVRGYGARGDGMVDDTSAVMAAVNAAAANGGGIVFFPPGVYKANIFLISINNIRLEGCGKSSKIVALGSGKNCLTMIECNYCSVENIYLYASGVDQGVDVTKDNGIYLQKCNDITITKTIIENHGFSGIGTFTSNDITIEDNLIQNGVGLLSTDASDIIIGGVADYGRIKILNNRCLSSGNNNGIMITADNSLHTYKDFLVMGNKSINHKRGGILAYITLTDANHLGLQDVKFIANTVEGNGRLGLYFQSVTGGVMLANKTRANLNGGGSDGIEGGIYCNGSIDITLTANIISEEIGPGLKCQGHSVYATRRKGVTVIGNTVKDCKTPGKPSIYVGQYANRYIIKGNTIDGGASQGIFVDGQTASNGKEILIEGNEVYGPQSYGIFVNGGSQTITNNQVQEAKFTGILATNCDYVNISDNTVVDCNFSNTSGLDGVGIAIASVTRFKVDGNHAFNRSTSGHQKYGFMVSGACTYGLLAHNDFNGNETDEVTVVTSPTKFIRSRNTDEINSPL